MKAIRNIKNWWNKQNDSSKKVILTCSALIVGSLVIYSKSFNYGWNCCLRAIENGVTDPDIRKALIEALNA